MKTKIIRMFTEEILSKYTEPHFITGELSWKEDVIKVNHATIQNIISEKLKGKVIVLQGVKHSIDKSTLLDMYCVIKKIEWNDKYSKFFLYYNTLVIDKRKQYLHINVERKDNYMFIEPDDIFKVVDSSELKKEVLKTEEEINDTLFKDKKYDKE